MLRMARHMGGGGIETECVGEYRGSFCILPPRSFVLGVMRERVGGGAKW